MIKPNLYFYRQGRDVTAFNSTRQGGYSEGLYGEFNINPYCGDAIQHIQQNRVALCQLFGIDERKLLLPHQVHETKVVAINQEFMQLNAEERQQLLEGVDALMTNVPEVCIGVSTADCIPVLLYDPQKRVAAAIHAGWRGTQKRIVERTISQMSAVYGSRSEDIVAQIGPGIHIESFEVGDEVYEAFAKEGFHMDMISRKFPSSDGSDTEKWHIDLPECNRQQLLALGIPSNQISVSAIDTFQQHETYFSARRLRINSGRIFSGILMV